MVVNLEYLKKKYLKNFHDDEKFCNFVFSQLFSKKCEFQNTAEALVNLARQDRAPEAAKRQITVQVLEFRFFAILKKNRHISRNRRTRCRWDPKRGPPGEGRSPDYCTILEVFFHFFAAKFPGLA